MIEFDKDGKVLGDGFHVIKMADGTTERLDFKDFMEFRHDHMCTDGPLWFVGKKRDRAGSVWINTNFIMKMDMTFNSEEVADALQMERMAAETEASVVGHDAEGHTVYADEVPQSFDFLTVLQSMITNGQAIIVQPPEEEEDGTIPGRNGN